MPQFPIVLTPMDQYNQELVQNLHPPNWVNPTPIACYNLVVIGAGTAGLVTAAGAALLGAKVALVEKHLLGGDCTNVGCVPSKALIRSARMAAAVRSAGVFGIHTGEATIDFAAVMERLRRVRAEISHHDAVSRFQQEFGVDVFLGEARFISADRIQVGETSLRFKRAVIATGSSPTAPPIPGLSEAGYLTNETVFSLTDCPSRLAVIGGGYIGCELAQSFQRLGAMVVLLHRGDRLLNREDADAAALLQRQFEQEGIQVLLQTSVMQVEQTATGKQITYRHQGEQSTVTVDEILVAIGRSPSVKGLDLDRVNVAWNEKQGILVNQYLQTTNPKIYAVGDVCMKWKFTHAADAAARIVIQNALFSVLGVGRKSIDSLVMPWSTYTEPEIAHVGLYPEEAADQNIPIETLQMLLTEVDRAVVDGETTGFAKVHLRKGTDQIVGATIVASHAGDLISQFTLMMTNRLGLKAIAKTIYPYPTQAELLRKLADEYNLRQLQQLRPITDRWLAWNRR